MWKSGFFCEKMAAISEWRFMRSEAHCFLSGQSGTLATNGLPATYGDDIIRGSIFPAPAARWWPSRIAVADKSLQFFPLKHFKPQNRPLQPTHGNTLAADVMRRRGNGVSG